jgi:HTH-type transcriptional regulator / antitoxin HipB
MLIQTPQDLGRFVKSVRKALGLTQDQLALTAGTNRRFIVELEQGKPTVRTALVLRVLQALGVTLALTAPPSSSPAHNPSDAGGKAGRKKSDGPAS